MKKKYTSPELEFDSFDLSEYICRELYGDFYAAGRSSDIHAAGEASWSTPAGPPPEGGGGPGGGGGGGR